MSEPEPVSLHSSISGVSHIRLIAVGLFFIGIIAYNEVKKKYFQDETKNNTFDPIPMYSELNILFEELSIYISYNKDLLYEIHSIVKSIATIHVQNKPIERNELLEIQLKLRKKIEEMKLYIPDEEAGVWDLNIKKIIKITQYIVTQILQHS